LVLRNGKWGDRQIVTKEWLEESITPRTLRPRTFGSHATDYGYLWWLLPIDGSGGTSDRNNLIITGSGARTQWLFVIPRFDLVVAVTGSSDASFNEPPDFLYSTILPAV